MTRHMTCDQFADSLLDYLESETDAPTRTAIEAHAVACAECGPMLADIRKLRVDAANLPQLAPRRDLWTGIAARIETPVVELKNGRTGEQWHGGAKRPSRNVWLGLAAAGLVAITATVTHEVTKRSVTADSARTIARSPNSDSAPSVATSNPTPAAQVANADTVPPFARSTVPPASRLVKLSPEKTYDLEIARLRAVLNQKRPLLDSATVAVVELNLKVIDDAIAQCRQALKKDPASRFLMESLNDALDTKIQLLRTAATLQPRA